MAKQIEIRVPDIGDFEGVEIIDVLVSAGDKVEEESPLITLETDKAAMDVPAPQAGTIKELKVSNGDKVSEGDVVAILEIADEDVAAAEEKPEVADDSSDDEATDDSSGSDDAAESGDDTGGKTIEVKVPDIGDFDNVEIIDLLVKAGDEVEEESPLITLETDKAAMDVPAPQAGTIKELKVKTGDTVSEGDVIALLETKGGSKKSKPAEEKTEKEPAEQEKAEAPRQEPKSSGTSKAAAGSSELPPIDEKSFTSAHASPSVRKFARELGVDLGRVSGSGVKGRITHEDVKGFVKSVMSSGGVATAGTGIPAVPSVDFAKFGEVETRPLSRIKKISGPRLQAAWLNAPHVTQHDDADITDLEAMRKALKSDAATVDAKLTPLPFLIKAVVHALKEFPDFNASLDPAGENLVMKKYFHIGFAVDTPGGLVVPVIKDADQKDVFQIARELAKLGEKARENKLKAADMQGGCFSISSLGSIGGKYFTPIVNAPEVAILGVSKASMQPVWNGSEFEPRLMLPLSLSYDHRVIDGAAAARFTTFLGEVLKECRNLVL